LKASLKQPENPIYPNKKPCITSETISPFQPTLLDRTRESPYNPRSFCEAIVFNLIFLFAQ